MQLYVRLGFELELYHHTELLSIYWYYDTILNYQMQNLRQYIKAPVPSMFISYTHLPPCTAKLPNESKTKKSKKKETTTQARVMNSAENKRSVLLEMNLLLCRASSRVCVFCFLTIIVPCCHYKIEQVYKLWHTPIW